MKTAKECITLREYREEVLAMPQTEIGRRCKRHQAWISFIERGHLPRAWNREALLKAYGLDNEDFARLVSNASKLNGLQKPIEPLFASAGVNQVAAQILNLEAQGKLVEAEHAVLIASEMEQVS